MILLEGVDRTGKTTVATALMKLLPGWSFVHQTKPDCHPFKYGMQRVVNSHPRVVMDRLHWSNYVYGHTYKGSQDLLTEHEWRITELALASRGTMVVYMHDDIEGILGRWGKGEMYPPTEIPQLLDHYRNLIGQAGERTTNLPVHIATLSDLVQDGKPTYRLQQLAAECEHLARMAAKFPPPSQGIGTVCPEFVIIGEAPADRCEPCGDVPRCPLDTGPGPGWLWQAIDELNCRWWEGYYTQVSSFADPGHFVATMNTMKPQVILSLGAKARDFVRTSRIIGLDDGIRFSSVEHPDFVRRLRDFTLWKLAVREALDSFCEAEKSVDWTGKVVPDWFDMEAENCA